MKRAIKRVVVMSILFAGLMTYAENLAPIPALEVTSVTAERFMMEIGMIKNTTLVQLKDSEGFVIYSEKMESGKKFRKIYDVASLPSKTYYLRVIDDEFSKIYAVIKKNDALKVKMIFSSPRINEKTLAILMN